MPAARRVAFTLALALALAFEASLARADDPPPALTADAPKTLHFSPLRDGLLTGIGLLGFVIPELAKSSLALDHCRVCHRLPSGEVNVNGFDRAVRNGLVGAFGVTPPKWAIASDVMAFGVIPALSLGADFWLANNGKFDRNFATDIGVVAESVLLAGALDQCVKFLVSRQRPFVAFDSPYAASLRHGTETTADDNLSFYSGHSSAAMATTVGIARVIQLRTGKLYGYYTLVPLGILTSLMRVAADKHWGTDVLTGMAVGTAAGLLLPTLHQ
jgi:membrane-associated phospholipid phosphatase